ncbi:hypothetical protein M4I32_14685 [Microbacterium sp. LRZ72]|uniref:hypothetical protein n=1 Tax=Microbacterium sp. LRZ72 TaxID=2942481 RepID=UPI0029A93C40|nr:hypothetical protein [Microbacterium sp. LRZ72]MDX2378036.1 hypothetical protein [Microbacterium sp. LRZ72]
MSTPSLHNRYQFDGVRSTDRVWVGFAEPEASDLPASMVSVTTAATSSFGTFGSTR